VSVARAGRWCFRLAAGTGQCTHARVGGWWGVGGSVLVFQARGGMPKPARRGVDGEVAEQRPWLERLASARHERVRAGSWNPRPWHGCDACGASASRAAATSQLQGWTRVTARPLQGNGMGGPRLAKDGSSAAQGKTPAVGGWTGEVAMLTS
jgi:hypothetical protein